MTTRLVQTSLDLAGRQHGVLARRQLTELGVPGTTITNRIRTGFLFPVFPGTYSVGRSDLNIEGLWMASVLAAGPGAVLAGRAAAAAWGFMKHRHSVDVICEGKGGGKSCLLPISRSRTWPYLFIHRVRSLPVEDIDQIHAIPVTSPSRTLVDLAGQVPPTQFEHAFMEADRLLLLEDEDLKRWSVSCRGRRGGSRFRQMAKSRNPDIKRARSILEGIFLRLAGKLETPEVNVRVLGKEMDFVWRQSGVIVECDGWAFHRGQEAFEEDALENIRLRSAGWTVLRLTWRMVVERPDEIERMVRSVLAEAQLSSN